MDSTAQPRPKLGDVWWRTIGERVLGLGPDTLVRVEFRGVGREPMDVKSCVLAQEVLDDDAPVNGDTVILEMTEMRSRR